MNYVLYSWNIEFFKDICSQNFDGVIINKPLK